jgi:hypothetical protein
MRWIVAALLLSAAPAFAGFTDSDAAAIAARSPAVKKSLATITTTIDRLPQDMASPTRDGLLTDATCIAYRKGETPESQRAVVDALQRAGYITDPAAATRSLYGYPVKADAACPKTAAPFLATPGSEEHSHHSWPGGLADHTAFNLEVGEDLVARYGALTGAAFDTAALNAGVLWHDWAKRLVLGWGDAGVVSYESPIAGTSSHHVIGLAEAMARNLPAREILVQACAHQAPSSESDAKVIGWIKAAATIAHADPVAKGYLKAGGTTLEIRPECRINNMADGNWVYGVPAAEHAKQIIARLAPQLGRKAADRAFLEYALSYYGAERFDAVSEAEALKLLKDLPPR